MELTSSLEMAVGNDVAAFIVRVAWSSPESSPWADVLGDIPAVEILLGRHQRVFSVTHHH